MVDDEKAPLKKRPIYGVDLDSQNIELMDLEDSDDET